MDVEHIHILLVEDEAAHIKLIRRAFESRAREMRLTVARSVQEARTSLAQSIPDLVITDFHLPDGKGSELLPAEGAESPYPVVIITSQGNEQTAVEVIKAGALDYLVKSRVTFANMPHIAGRALREWRHVAERAQAEAALRESKKRYALTTSAGQVGVWDWDLATNEIYLDPNLKAMLGYADHEIRNHLDDWGQFVHPDDVEQVMAAANAHLEGLTPQYEIAHRMLHRDGSIRWFLARGTAMRDESGKPYRVVGTDTDITERKRTEATWQALNAAAALQRAGLSEAEVYQAATEQLETLGLRGAISLLDEATDSLAFAHLFIYAELLRALERLTGISGAGFRFPRARVPVFAQVIESGEAVYVTDSPTQIVAKMLPESVSRVAGRIAGMLGPANSIVAPLRVEGRVAGLLHASANWLTEADVPAITAFADQLSAALENARLFEEAREHAGKLAALYKTGKDITSTLELDALLQLIAERATQLTGADKGLILLADTQAEKLIRAVGVGFIAGQIEDFTYQEVQDGISGWVLREKMPTISEDILTDPRNTGLALETAKREPETARSIAVAPLSIKGEAIGTLTVLNNVSEPVFNQGDLDLVVMLASQAAIAIENARLFEAEREQRQQAEALRQVAHTVGASLELNEILRLLLKHLKHVLVYDNASILVLRKGELPELVVGIGYEDEQLTSQEAGRLLKSSPILRQMERDRQPVVSADVRQLEGWVWVSGAEHVRSWLGIPLVVQGQMIGALMIDSARPGHFGETEAQLAQVLAQHAAQAIENARLFEETRRRLDELTVLHAVSTAGAEAASKDDLIECATQVIGETLYPDNFGLLLLDEAAGVLRVHPSYRGVREETKDLTFPLGHGIAGTVAARGQPWRVRDVRREPKYLDVNPNMRSELCVPLKVGERVIGVFNTESARPDAFTEADERLLTTLAGQLATAIEKVRLHEHLQQQAEELAAKNAELEAFVYTVSHDLKSPVVTVQGFAGALREDCGHLLPPAGHKSLEFIETAATRMELLIKDLLALSRIGRIGQPPQTAPFGELVEKAVSLMAPRLEERCVALTVADDFPTVHGDRERLVQALENLLTNAVKFMGEQAEPRIEVGWEGSADGMDGAEGSADGTEGADSSAEGPRFFVRDNGLGVAPEYHTRIFEIFQRLGQVDDPEGTGVGLALVKRIVENHGGQVWVESEGVPGEGSTFYFTLPGGREA